MSAPSDRKPPDVNPLRARVIKMAAEVEELSGRMADVESLFFNHVLIPGMQLRQAVRKREFLEQQAQRIREKISRLAYPDAAAAREDVERTLREAADLEARGLGEDAGEESGPSIRVEGGRPDEDDEWSPAEKEKINRQFRKTVIPRVHADTSSTPFEVFQKVYGAYKRQDFLMMKAYIIQYRGDIVRGDCEAFEIFAERCLEAESDCLRALAGLERRQARLRARLTDREVERRDELLRDLRTQSREILEALTREAEEIVRLQRLIEDLADKPFTIH